MLRVKFSWPDLSSASGGVMVQEEGRDHFHFVIILRYLCFLQVLEIVHACMYGLPFSR